MKPIGIWEVLALKKNKRFKPVLRIRDTLVRIDPRIHTSKNGNNYFLFLRFFCLSLFEATFTSFSKDKKSYRSQKQQESRFILLFLLDDRRIRIRTSYKWIRIQELRNRTLDLNLHTLPGSSPELRSAASGT